MLFVFIVWAAWCLRRNPVSVCHWLPRGKEVKVENFFWRVTLEINTRNTIVTLERDTRE